ncbi:MAG TPA: PstS family phosphate ABC transporter substrate-binding protein [Actinomycetota bacterium]|nr:PstS family phosphate ABC transporter substrate-binding protein [Actinomycetota bacterium]
MAACGGSNNSSTLASPGDDGGAAGSVRVDGSSTVAPLTSAAAEMFKETNPDVNVTVGTSGTGGGFEKFCRGETDMSDASRPIEDDEAANCKKAGIGYQEMVVANDALTVVVNSSNDFAQCLTVGQLKKIWEPDSKITNWNQVDATFPDEPLKLFGPGTDSGTFDYFTDVINGEEGASRTDYTPSEDDNVVVTGVSGSTGGMGYFGYTYFEENQDKVRAVQIDNGDGCVAPSPQTVQDGSYEPLGRPLFVYPSVKSLGENAAFASFLQYYVDNNAEIAEAALFIPLNDEQVATLNSEYADAKSAAGLS